MNAEWIWFFNIVAVWYFILSSNVITLYDQTWLISVNISRLLRKCFLFLFLFWWRRSYTFIWDLSLLLFCWQCTFSASNTCFFFCQSCEHPWEIELDHPKTHCLKSLPYNTDELCDCRSNQFRKGEEKKMCNATRVLTYQRLICFQWK